MLLESVPFILAGAFCARILARSSHVTAYLGCGCGSGPAARSFPAALAAWFIFGPWIALGRFGLAAIVDAAAFRKRSRAHHEQQPATLMHELVFPALASATCVPMLPAIAGMHAPPALLFAISAIVAFASAPCALGSISMAAAMRAAAPAAAAGFLCVAGIFDWRTWRKSTPNVSAHDFLAYSTAAIACAIIAARHGGSLVNPRIAITLWPSAVALAVFAWRHRNATYARLRLAPAIMFVGCVLGAPPPSYHATETTLVDAFAGEHLDFTGEVARNGSATMLVRYAITCCRADAAPVAIRLDNAPTLRSGWFRASGSLIERDEGLRLKIDRIESIPRPSDPFIYR
ncbi:MAG TPA: hypothetical protein VGR69_03655 [Candidatus Rubrimentiphilum sp.]|nr:hypothetical protein [Candidatus Rubrimentiphilum sp.]